MSRIFTLTLLAPLVFLGCHDSQVIEEEPAKVKTLAPGELFLALNIELGGLKSLSPYTLMDDYYQAARFVKHPVAERALRWSNGRQTFYIRLMNTQTPIKEPAETLCEFVRQSFRCPFFKSYRRPAYYVDPFPHSVSGPGKPGPGEWRIQSKSTRHAPNCVTFIRRNIICDIFLSERRKTTTSGRSCVSLRSSTRRYCHYPPAHSPS